MDYKESELTGKKWRRAYRIQIDNLYKRVPSVQYVEQDIITISENEFVEKHVGVLDIVFNPENPLHLQAYDVFDKIYIEEREKRDLQIGNLEII